MHIKTPLSVLRGEFDFRNALQFLIVVFRMTAVDVNGSF